MKNFKKFVEEKDMALGDVGYSNASENDILNRIAKIAIDDHLKEVLNFFEHLSKKSTRIRSEFDAYKKDKVSGISRRIPKEHMPIYDDGKDIVVPASADMGGSATTEE